MSYPPPHHMLRDLQISTEPTGEGSILARAPAQPHSFDDAGGVRIGVIATVIDAAGASCVMRSIAPDRSATEELAYQSRRPARRGPLLAHASLIRQGSRQAIVSVELREGEDPEPIGFGTMLFHRLPQRADHTPIRSGARRAQTVGRLDEPYLQRAGLRFIDPEAGVVEIDNHAWVRNSFGSLNGGMVATVLEAAGEQAARAATGQKLVVADLSVQYLAQSSPGPLRTHAQLIRTGRDHAVVRVSLLDGGDGERLLSIGTVTAALLG